jgi:hypothetical protein
MRGKLLFLCGSVFHQGIQQESWWFGGEEA